MFEIVSGRAPDKKFHAKVLAGVLPVWIVGSFFIHWVLGSGEIIFRQRLPLVMGAVFFFILDFVTAVVCKCWIRGTETFNSEGLSSGAQKLGLWVVVATGTTAWANLFPNDPDEIRWYDPRWLGANVDLLAFLYMYTVDLISSIENITGKSIGETGIGRFVKSVTGSYFPKMSETIDGLEGQNSDPESSE